MYISSRIKEKFFENGYNLIAAKFIGGISLLCVVVYVDRQGFICGKITCTDGLDEYNAALKTCNYGASLELAVIVAFFPKIEQKIRDTKKDFPRHF